MAKRDYYEVLGIKKEATADEIEKAWKRIRSKRHPDKGGDKEAFQEAKDAYETLSDERKRAQYDQFGATFGGGPGGPDDIGDPMWTHMDPELREVLRRAREEAMRAGRQNQQVMVDVAVPVDVMLNGGKVITRYPIHTGGFGFQHNMVELEIPEGMKVGQRFKKPGLDNVTFAARAEGNRSCIVQGLDLIIPALVDVTHVMCEIPVKIRHPRGSLYEIRVPEGWKSGQNIRIPHQGLEGMMGAKGHLFVNIQLVTPTLTDEQKAAMKEILNLS